MVKLNVAKRRALLSTFGAEGGHPGLPVPLVESLARSLHENKMVGIRGMQKTGKTTVLLAMRRALLDSGMFREVDLLDAGLQAQTGSLARIEESARKNGVVLLDEVTGVAFVDESIRTGFFHLVRKLHADGIRILLAYHRGWDFPALIEAEFPSMPVFTIRATLSEAEAHNALTVPFEDTGVALSDATKEAILRLSGRYPSVMANVCNALLGQRSEAILGSQRRIVLDEDPEPVAREVLTNGVAALYLKYCPDRTSKAGFYISLIDELTPREKELMERIVHHKGTRGFAPELEACFRWGIIEKINKKAGRKGEIIPVPLPLAMFVQNGLHHLQVREWQILSMDL